jgi:N6-adenosine-specific RNA methylase IME4/uncharacterized membrane protein
MNELIIPQPGRDLLPDGWWKTTVVPWADEQINGDNLRKGAAKLAALEAATKAMGLDAIELMKGRRYIELDWGKLLGKGKDTKGGRGRKASLAGEALDHNDRHRFRQLAEYAKQVMERLETADKEDKCTRTALLRMIKDAERNGKRTENERLAKKTNPFPDGPFSTIVVDPPWSREDEGDVDQFGRAQPAYAMRNIEQLINPKELPIKSHAADNAHLYLWITNRSLPKGFSLMAEWGFRYITCLTWCKPSFGIGNYYRGQTEHILFGIRGSLPLLRNDVGTCFNWPRQTNHSQKPEEAYELIETCSPGPWLDAFARRKRRGWICWGAEIGTADF